jgi:hypothetical protein
MITDQEARDALYVLEQYVEQQKKSLAPSDKQKAFALQVAKSLNQNIDIERMNWRDMKDYLDKWVPVYNAQRQAVTASPR